MIVGISVAGISSELLKITPVKSFRRKAGVGAGDYSFKSDKKGAAKYSATISSAELEKWQMFEIAYHPDGDAKDMKKMEIALSGAIKMGK